MIHMVKKTSIWRPDAIKDVIKAEAPEALERPKEKRKTGLWRDDTKKRDLVERPDSFPKQVVGKPFKESGLSLGRPQKLTPEVQERIIQAVRIGCYFSSAAAAAGVHSTTLSNWMKWGEEGKEPYASFRQEMLIAEEACEEELIQMWRAHMPKNWMAVAAFLERRHPERWSRRDITKIDNKTDIRLQVNYVNEWHGGTEPIDVTPRLVEDVTKDLIKEALGEQKNGRDKHDSTAEKTA
jgi:hypothetical protein